MKGAGHIQIGYKISVKYPVLIISILLLFVFALSACGQKASTWQEQYDLGVRYLSEGNYEEAVIAFTAAIEIDPKKAPAYVGRGNAYVLSAEVISPQSPEFKNAEADYLYAIEIDDRDSEPYMKLADLYLSVGDIDSAISVLENGYKNTADETLRAHREELGPAGSDVVEWDDTTFEQLVRNKIGKQTGPVYVNDLDYITDLSIWGDTHIFINDEEDESNCSYRHLTNSADDSKHGELTAYYGYGNPENRAEFEEHTVRGSVASVASLRYFRNLQSVTVIANQVKDVSVLEEMKAIEFANFWGNEISDLSPIYALPRYVEKQEQFVEIGALLEIG